jgi:hypothetical protein
MRTPVTTCELRGEGTYGEERGSEEAVDRCLPVHGDGERAHKALLLGRFVIR